MLGDLGEGSRKREFGLDRMLSGSGDQTPPVMLGAEGMEQRSLESGRRGCLFFGDTAWFHAISFLQSSLLPHSRSFNS